MNQPLAITIRAKKLGVLIKDARLASDKTIEFCANILGITPEAFTAYEYGQLSPTLPEIEALAYSLDLQLDHFWGHTSLFESKPETDKSVKLEQVISLRQKTIGATLKKHRLDAEITLEALSERTGLPVSTLTAYENLSQPVPLPALEAITSALGHAIQEHIDTRTVVGTWAKEQQAIQDFLELPEDLQAFVCKPVNQPFLDLAVRLSNMSVDKLRGVAEGLLEITL